MFNANQVTFQLYLGRKEGESLRCKIGPTLY